MNFEPGSPLRQIIKEEFMSPEHKSFRDVFFKVLNKNELDQIQTIFYNDLTSRCQIIWFKDWFLKQEHININVIKDHSKEWKTKSGNTFKSHHPPTDDLLLIKKGENTETGSTSISIEASALVKPTSKNIINNEACINQANWTNISLQVIGRQLDRIEDSILDNKRTSNTVCTSEVHPVDIQPPTSIPNFKLTDSQDEEFMDQLIEKLKKTTLHVLNEESEQEQSGPENNFKSSIQDFEASLHKIEYNPSGLKTYYQRPTP